MLVPPRTKLCFLILIISCCTWKSGKKDKLPYSIRVLLESALRNCDDFAIKPQDVENILNWETTSKQDIEIPFKPARVILQDFT